MPHLSTALIFIGVSFVLVATPGPGVLYVVGRSVDEGRRAGVASMLGIEAAELVHLVAVAAGLSALLASSPTTLAVIRYAGAAYLVVLGVRRWREAALDPAASAPTRSARRIAAEGFTVQLLNPKVAIFFLAYFPQFLRPDGPVLTQTLVLGALYLAVAAASDLAYVLASSLLARRLRRSAVAQRRAARTSGVLYVSLGLLAALAGRRPLVSS